MAAGGSDFSGLVQGGMGQGFAQGVQQGTDAYNRGVDRKTAQANTYLTQFIGPNLQRLSQGLPRPGPDATQDEWDKWVQAENARRGQLDVLFKQSDTYLKQTGSPVSAEEWRGLWYDPNSAVSAEDWNAISKDYASFRTVNGNVQRLQQELAKIDPVEQPELYAQKKAQYDKYKKDNNYEARWSKITGASYVEFVGGEGETQARRNDLMVANDQKLLSGLFNSSDPAISGLARQLFQAGKPLDSIDPSTGKPIRDTVMAMLDKEGLDNLIEKGGQEGIQAALQRIGAMTDAQRQDLTPQAAQLWNQFKAYQQDPNSIPIGPNKTVFNAYKQSDFKTTQEGQAVDQGALNLKLSSQALQQGVNNLTLSGQAIDKNKRDAIFEIGAQAAQGNALVGSMRSEFDGLLGPEIPADVKDKLWDDGVIKPLQAYTDKQAQNFKYVESQLVGMQLNNSNTLQDTITKGQFHLTGMFKVGADGKTYIDKDSEVYKRVVQVQGNPSDAALITWYDQSLKNYNNLDTKTQQDLRIGAAQVRTAEANAKITEVDAHYASTFADLKRKDMTYSVIQSRVQSEIAGAQAKGQMAVLMAQAVEQGGVGILDDPAFKADFTKALGGDKAYAAAKSYLTAQQSYKLKAQQNQLMAQANDEFDRMFKSPEAMRMYLSDPKKVEQIAKNAGLSPAAVKSALAQMISENKTMTDLQIKDMRFSIYAREQGLDLQWKQFYADQEQRTISNGFQFSQDKLAWEQFADSKKWRDVQWQADVMRDARDYRFRLTQQGDDRAASIRQYQAMFLGPLQESLQITQNQLATAQGEFNKMLEGTPYKDFVNSNITWTRQSDGTYKASPKNAGAKATFDSLVRNGTISALEAGYTKVQGFQADLTAGQNIYQQLIQGGKDSFGDGVGDMPTVPGRQGSVKPGGATLDFKAYKANPSSKQGDDIANFVISAANGQQSKTYPNITAPGYCTTFVQAMMANVMNVPGGIPTGGINGANGFWNGILAKGASQVKGTGAGGSLSVNDIKNLPDGTLLFQKDGTREGHVAIVLNGVVVQNSRYSDNKINGAIGTMSLQSFISAEDTFAVTIPSSWYKNGAGNITPVAKPATPTGGTSGGNTAQPPRPVQGKYSNGDGGFRPDVVSITSTLGNQLNKSNSGVRMAASPGGNTGLTFQVAQGRYAVITNDNVARDAIGRVATQFGIHFSQQMGSPLSVAYRRNPQQVRNALVVELKQAGFTGDINRYLDSWLKSKGWAK